jgi:short-chain fatty acids transporter
LQAFDSIAYIYHQKNIMVSNNNRTLIPSPLMLAIILSFVVYFLAFFFTNTNDQNNSHAIQLLIYYQNGMWDLLAFAMQMMLILVLGNVLALTPLFQKIIHLLVSKINNSTYSIALTALFSILLSYFNWGLGLIFSALLARSIAEHARQTSLKLNYPLLVAAAYSGLMVWHGGLSGSAPLKVAEAHHFLIDKIGVIPVNETLFSPMNISLFMILIFTVPLCFYVLAKTNKDRFTKHQELPKPVQVSKTNEKRQYLGFILGLTLAFAAVYQFYIHGLAALNINLINLILLSLGLLLYANINLFMKAVNASITSSSGIMIQFPLYAGIMGLLKYSGLIHAFTDNLVLISSSESLPIYSFISAAVVNFFVPSGGGQWAVQGPILMDAAHQLGASIPKTIMALAYGDQLTNMIQPFWAIPLLAITGVKAKQMIPYTFIIMITGALASLAVLYFF